MRLWYFLPMVVVLSVVASCEEKDDERSNIGEHNGHYYVDLGLPSGLLWATCNVCANSTEEAGDFFSWGETTGYNSGKNIFNWSSYKFEDDNGSLIKYNNSSNCGLVDDKIKLDLDDDAAHANWGGKWRLPTSAEQEELINNCTLSDTFINDVWVVKFTSKINGEILYFPAVGYHVDNNPYYYGMNFCSYWSSSLSERSSYYACGLCIGLSGVSVSYIQRSDGLCARAVYSPSE